MDKLSRKLYIKEWKKNNKDKIKKHDQKYYKNNIEKLAKLSKLKVDKKLYDVMEVILERLAGGESVEEIIEKVEA